MFTGYAGAKAMEIERMEERKAGKEVFTACQFMPVGSPDILRPRPLRSLVLRRDADDKVKHALFSLSLSQMVEACSEPRKLHYVDALLLLQGYW